MVNVAVELALRVKRRRPVETAEWIPKRVSKMVGRIHNCEKCGGFLALFYDGWNCSRCGRKYFIQGNQLSEMW